MYFERSNNLLYRLLGDGTAKSSKIYKKKKGSGWYDNLLIYDIPKESHCLILKEEEELEVRGICFEQSYDTSRQCMVTAGNLNQIKNNFDLKERLPMDLILLETIHAKSGQHALWKLDKWGFERNKIIDFSAEVNWYWDVFNQLILVEREDEQLGLRYEVFDLLL